MACPACFSGHVDSGKPTGRIEILHGRETYIADPPDGKPPKGIVIIIPDAFGLPFVNNKILADHYAAGGQFTTYLPDFMDGKPAPIELMGIMHRLTDPNDSWIWKPWYIVQVLGGMIPFFYYNRFNLVWPKITSFLRSVRSTPEGAKLPIGVAGFCWGGPGTLKLSSDSAEARTSDGKQPLAEAFFTAHPSLLSIPDDIKQVKTNISFALGGDDTTLPMTEIEKIKAELAKMDSVDSEVVIYPGGGHGFAIRGDKKSNTKVVQQSEDAEKQALAWFQKQFAKVKY